MEKYQYDPVWSLLAGTAGMRKRKNKMRKKNQKTKKKRKLDEQEREK